MINIKEAKQITDFLSSLKPEELEFLDLIKLKEEKITHKKRMKRIKYTDKQYQEAIVYLQNNHSLADSAKMSGISYSALRHRLDRQRRNNQ